MLLEVVEKTVPKRMSGEDLRIPDDDKTLLRTRNGDIQPPWVVEETNTVVIVRTNA